MNRPGVPALSEAEWNAGLTYDAYLDTLDRFRPYWDDGYRDFTLPPALTDRVATLSHERRVAILSGGFCPDCSDFIPVFARIAERSGLVECRVFPREAHRPLAVRFAVNGKHYVPTVIVMDRHFSELGRFVERPQLLKDILAAGGDPRRFERRSAYQLAAAEEFTNLLFTSE